MDSKSPAQPKKHKRLTIKESKLVQAKVKGLTLDKAYVEAGYAPTNKQSSVTNAYKTLKKPHVKEALDRALVKHGITLDTAIAPIGKALTALKMNEYTGEVTEDIQTQLKGSDRALKLMGVGQDKQEFSAQYMQIINEKGSKYND